MKQILLFSAFLALPFLLPTTPLFARGHGGGGGHGGGHSSHSSHSSNNHSSFTNNNSVHKQANAKRNNTKAVITRSTSPSVIAAHHSRTLSGRIAATHVNAATLSNPAARASMASGSTATPYYENYGNGSYYGAGFYGGYYGNPYAYYPYYAGPIFYDPYYSPFTTYFGFMYSPSYYPVSSPYYSENNESQISRQPMDGFVVFYNDTLSGAVTVAKRAISMETRDSGKDYDYRFHEKDPGLQYVTVYNDDDKQMNLVRLKGDTKKLWRVIHTGKLNIYDGRRGFIYKPEDVELKTLTVYYNGEISSLNSSSVKKAKEWLTNYVNRAYGLSLDPRDFSWKELLIYVDKLD